VTLYNIVNPGSLVSGQPQDVSQVLANFTAIQNVLNGNIDGSNIAAGGVANSKLAGYPWANADIAAGAAIAYSKLNLAGSVVNADVAAAAALVPSKFAGFPNDATKYLAGDGSWPVLSAGGGGALTMFYDSQTAGVGFPVASITTPSLPQTSKHLMVIYGRAQTGAAALDNLGLRISGISSANYYSAWLQCLGTSVSSSGNGPVAGYVAGMLGQNTGYGGGGVTIITDYATAAYHSMVTISMGINSTPQANLMLSGGWLGVGGAIAVTSLTWYAWSGNNLTSGRYTVYGFG
jgi:hypothetical protein